MSKRVLPLFRNFYFVAGLCFLIWMIFLDSNDLITRFKMSMKMRSLQNEKEFYQEKITEVKKDKQELTTNKQLLEKFAREKYLMKKPTEDIFIIEEK